MKQELIKYYLLLLVVILCSINVKAQTDFKVKYPKKINNYIDTVQTRSNDGFAIHYHKVSKKNERKFTTEFNDEIFDSTSNQFSRLVYSDIYHYFNVPTVPLTHLYILKSKGLVLGLSTFETSPYHLVIYSLDGELLHKRRFGQFELKVSKDELRRLISTFKGFEECLERQPYVLKEGEYYYIELTNCMIRTITGNSIVKEVNKLIPNRFFPYTVSTTAMPHKYINGVQHYAYKEYSEFIDRSDPLYDLIMIGKVPYMLILHNERGEKVNIPLVSNCDILREIED